ncbi:MAG: stage 0 sporulation protein [Lachnospiraceae bacterium]|nr:stage 0 sporulation protein [Lachnospiraceae bacterium]
MKEIIGVSFRSVGKIYYFSPEGFEIKRGDYVIVETVRGMEMGKVVLPPRTLEDEEVTQPLKRIIRIATPEDKEKAAIIRAKEKSAVQVCKQKIYKHNLQMKLIDAEYTFDESKLLFYFTADGRVDFRELVKDLAFEFRTRIELRQVGVRDETKILGGIGICGRELCCHSYLTDFVPVSIKMAKEQNLSLNPTKISGNCGRLMCCLKNEQEAYEELNKHLPGVGDVIMTSDGVRGRVDAVDVLRQRVWIMVHDDEGNIVEKIEIGADKVAYRISRGKKNKGKKYIPDATEEELRALEDRDSQDEAVKEEKPRDKEDRKRNDQRRDNSKRDGSRRDDRRRDNNRDNNRTQKGDDSNRDNNRDNKARQQRGDDQKHRNSGDFRKKRFNKDKKKSENRNEN